MQFTVRAKLLPSKEEEAKLNTLSRIFPSMVRYAYNRLIEGYGFYDIVKMLYELFIPNARWCQWAVKEAQAILKSQKELLPFPQTVSLYMFCFIVIRFHWFRLVHRDLGIPMGSWVTVEPNGIRLPSRTCPVGLGAGLPSPTYS